MLKDGEAHIQKPLSVGPEKSKGRKKFGLGKRVSTRLSNKGEKPATLKKGE